MGCAFLLSWQRAFNGLPTVFVDTIFKMVILLSDPSESETAGAHVIFQVPKTQFRKI